MRFDFQYEEKTANIIFSCLGLLAIDVFYFTLVYPPWRIPNLALFVTAFVAWTALGFVFIGRRLPRDAKKIRAAQSAAGAFVVVGLVTLLLGGQGIIPNEIPYAGFPGFSTGVGLWAAGVLVRRASEGGLRSGGVESQKAHSARGVSNGRVLGSTVRISGGLGRHETTSKFEQPPGKVYDAVLQVVHKLGWRVEGSDSKARELAARIPADFGTSWSNASWGTAVRVRGTGDPEGPSTLSSQSRTKFRFTLFEGRTKRDVHLLHDAVSALLSA